MRRTGGVRGSTTLTRVAARIRGGRGGDCGGILADYPFEAGVHHVVWAWQMSKYPYITPPWELGVGIASSALPLSTVNALRRFSGAHQFTGLLDYFPASSSAESSI